MRARPDTSAYDAEFENAKVWAQTADDVSLDSLSRASPSVRNAPEVYALLSKVGASNSDAVIDYIVHHCKEDPRAVLMQGIEALCLINTHKAEIAIADLARTFSSKHIHAHFGANCIGALERMGSETAADFILELGRRENDLVLQALRSVKNLYIGDPARFQSQYAQVVDFATKRAVLVQTIDMAFDESDDLEALRQEFEAADAHGILSKVKLPIADEPVGFCMKAFQLAVHEAQLTRDLRAADINWNFLLNAPRVA